MSQVSIVRTNAILPFPAGEDLTGKEGRPIVIHDDPIAYLPDDPESVAPLGVLLKGGKQGETVSVAIAAGGLAGTVRLRVTNDVMAGELLQAEVDGFARQQGINRWTCAQALEDGFAGERIEAVLFKPEFRGP